ncbi:peptide/nickel transport system substrate-binding protein [Plasticicumulans lactativorans]|uniref:Peptide/nickel transport system substrate-binding protein n=1 Tax=Plasticicumulans lactativorans TaxID=1133106 RepID=A0A4R2L6A4_9GAMM|nr:ABC transporter substrate-binding protein [Plasticicumulans lactativorans]TCO79599.1 peptide/nickel transport system substrate-binding protein [Plasticicumulans lactativorans]
MSARLHRFGRWCAALALAALAGSAAALDYIETPSLQAQVDAGALPPVAMRLPATPRVIDLPAMGRELGRHGGTVRTLLGGQKDIRMMTLYGYARLVAFDPDLNLVPDLLESFTVDEGRVFTLHLRAGHRWSDGQPFTAEDFRYAWEDVLNNPELSAVGLPNELVVNGHPPRFEVLDPLTVRYSWDAPNPDFLPALAAAQPLQIAIPAHYLGQFHRRYRDVDELKELARSLRLRNWVSLHDRMSRWYRPENPDLPTLGPWINTTAPPAERFVFVRNPYYHRVDSAGRQLPYIDSFVLDMSTTSLIPVKAGANAADLQARYLRFEDYPFLKEAEQRHPFDVRLWERGQGSTIAILPNLNVQDDVWRALLQDVRVRRALSLGINRHEINQAVYFGLARESADTVLPESPLFRPAYASAWTHHDPAQANALLDAAGLDRRDVDGIRLLPDGRRAEMTIETAGESTEETDVLELVVDHWHALGLKLFVRAASRDVFRSRMIGGQTLLGVWSGLDNGIPTRDMSPEELVPTTEQQLHWPQWGMYYENGGRKGVAPTLPAAQELVDRLRDWCAATTPEQREAAWHAILQIYSDQVFTIGIVNGSPQPVLVSRRLHNVPREAVYNFNPGAFFGVYMPDTFWFTEEGR